MDEQEEFGVRYRRWIDACMLEQSKAAAVWQRIYNQLELGQAPLSRGSIADKKRVAFEGTKKT